MRIAPYMGADKRFSSLGVILVNWLRIGISVECRDRRAPKSGGSMSTCWEFWATRRRSSVQTGL